MKSQHSSENESNFYIHSLCKEMQSHKKELHWFRRSGIFYAPNSPIAWVLILIAAAYLTYAFIEIDSRSHSVSDTLMNWVFNALLIGGALYAVAWLSSGKK